MANRSHRTGSPPVADTWKGERLAAHQQGAAPVEVALPRGARIVTTAGPVWYTDLPAEGGSRTLGEYAPAWQPGVSSGKTCGRACRAVWG